MAPGTDVKRVAGLCVIVVAVASFTLYNFKTQPIIAPKMNGVVRRHDNWKILDELDEYKPPSSAEIRKVMKSSETFDIKLPIIDKMKDFKSLCWKENGKLHCFPNAYLLGFTKCATGSIWAGLHSHPQVEGNAARKPNGKVYPHGKESHWWSKRRYWGDTIGKYSEEFGRALSLLVKKKDWKKTLLIDGSPDTIWDPGRRVIYDQITEKEKHAKDLPAPSILPASFIKEYTPESRFIISLRNPVERLYSHERMFNLRLSKSVKLRPIPTATFLRNFHRKVVLAVGILKACFKRRTLRECAYDPEILRETTNSKMAKNYRYVTIQTGLYVVFISDWLKILPRDKFYIATKEEYASNPAKVVGEIINFLELDEVNLYSDGLVVPPVAAGANISNTPPPFETNEEYIPMWNQTAEVLDAFYRPFNEALAKLLGNQKYLWL